MKTETKKIHDSIERALQSVQREFWPTSETVSHTLLKCVRLRGIVRLHLMRRGVDLDCMDDVIAEVAVVMQMKMVSRLRDPRDVYYVIYQVAAFVASNYSKKSINTSHSEEISLSSLVRPDDTGSENDVLDRLTSDSALENEGEHTNRRIDLDNARRRLSEKIAAFGWPQDIQKERTRLGRPPKMQSNVA